MEEWEPVTQTHDAHFTIVTDRLWVGVGYLYYCRSMFLLGGGVVAPGGVALTFVPIPGGKPAPEPAPFPRS